MKNVLAKSLIGFSLMLLTALTACQPASTLSDAILLADDWQVQASARTTLSGEQLSTPSADVQGWYQASVPSTVMGVLTQNGLYTDAMEAMNYKKIDKTQFDASWWYRKEFALPALKEGQSAALQIDGISYRANIWLNGKQIASKDDLYGPFRQFRLDITEAVQQDNVLAVEVFRAQPGEPNIGFVDWNPRPADESMGIYREVRVLLSGEVSMAHTAVHSKVNTETLDEAWLTLETYLTNHAATPVKGQLKGTMEGKSFTVPVELAAGETRVVKVTSEDADMLYLKNPRIWWCRNMGSPEMYAMDVEFLVDGEVSDNASIDFGVREIKEFLTEEDYRGFLLNGKKVLVRSAGWSDDIFLRDTPQSNEMQVQYVADMNLNSIRFENVWGTSHNIYDLCDRYGLLALVGWSCHWEWENYLGSPVDEYGGIITEHDMDLIAKSFKDQILWLRNHPSIITWFVGSDMMPRPALEKRYIEILKEIDDRNYITAAKAMTSEISGPSGTKMVGPYEYVAPNYWYAEEAPGGAFGFNTETGIGAQLPVIESLRKMIPADKMWPINEYWNYHCTTSSSAMNNLDVLTKNITARYGKAADLNDYLRKADLLNYEGTRTMFEAFRVNFDKTTGIVQWMLNSAWPSLYWQLYDWYGVPTAAYYSVKKANRTQQLIYNYGDKAVYAVNESQKAETLKGKMLVYDLGGKLLASEEASVTVAPSGVEKVFASVPMTVDNAILMLQVLDADGKLVADNVYTLSATEDVHDWSKSTWYDTPLKQCADFTKLASMPANELAAVKAEWGNDADSRVLDVTLEAAKDAPVAFFIRLSLTDAQGELVNPVFWEENYLTLAPGEVRTVRCNVPQGTSLPENVTLNVAGWNVPATSVALAAAK